MLSKIQYRWIWLMPLVMVFVALCWIAYEIWVRIDGERMEGWEFREARHAGKKEKIK